MKAPDKIYVEVCEDGVFAFPEPPFVESVEYIRADINKQPVEGLEEAADAYEQEYFTDATLEEAFIAGAEWMAEHAKEGKQ